MQTISLNFTWRRTQKARGSKPSPVSSSKGTESHQEGPLSRSPYTLRAPPPHTIQLEAQVSTHKPEGGGNQVQSPQKATASEMKDVAEEPSTQDKERVMSPGEMLIHSPTEFLLATFSRLGTLLRVTFVFKHTFSTTVLIQFLCGRITRQLNTSFWPFATSRAILLG